MWFGRDTFLTVGMDTPAGLEKHASVVDQSDGWACVTLSGSGAEDVLARLCPVDLRLAQFGVHHSVRTMIQHMNGAVTRVSDDTFELMVMRSMGQTLWHDVETAMIGVAGRG